MLLNVLLVLPSISARAIHCHHHGHHGRQYWTPSLSTTFLLDLDREPVPCPTVTTNTGINLNEDVYTVDLYGSTVEQIQQYHDDGKKVTCYFTAGTWDQWNADILDFDPACYCGPGVARNETTGICVGPGSTTNKQPDWNEWFFDLHTPSCFENITGVLANRIITAQQKGCDAIDPDNVDTYQQSGQKFGVTQEDEYNFLMFLAQHAHANGLAIDLKNDNGMLIDESTGEASQWQQSIVENFDWNVIEACHVYDQCDQYASMLQAGKPQIMLEYNNYLTECPEMQPGQKLLVFSGPDIGSQDITLVCGE